jgi:hypothetical protein
VVVGTAAVGAAARADATRPSGRVGGDEGPLRSAEACGFAQSDMQLSLSVLVMRVHQGTASHHRPHRVSHNITGPAKAATAA